MHHPLANENPLIYWPFNEQPPDHRVRIFGLDFSRVDLDEGGELFVTEDGWERLPAILPEHWFLNERYVRDGVKLAGGTGMVYGLDAPIVNKPNLRLVVKFARTVQDVPLFVAGDDCINVSNEDIANARWNSPFEEFGLLHELRTSRYGPSGLGIRTKRPLAIYCPPTDFPEWKLGRGHRLWTEMEKDLQHEQFLTEGEPVHLHETRLYVMLFEWVVGTNAEDCHSEGLISDQEMYDLTKRVVGELKSKGFHVLDNKPKHFILRKRKDGTLLRRNGELVYALIDFELLKRTPEYHQWLVDHR